MGKSSTAKRKAARTRAERHRAREDTRLPARPDVAPIIFAPPLRPRPKLLMVLIVLLALWIAFLLVLYFRTVYPHAGSAPASQPVGVGETAR